MCASPACDIVEALLTELLAHWVLVWPAPRCGFLALTALAGAHLLPCCSREQPDLYAPATCDKEIVEQDNHRQDKQQMNKASSIPRQPTEQPKKDQKRNDSPKNT